MGFLLLTLGLPLLGILFRLAAKLRLLLPLLYALIAPTVFSGWFHANPLLANGIGFALIGLAALSWLVTLASKIQDVIEEHREAQAAIELLAYRVRQARANGENTVSTAGLWR